MMMMISHHRERGKGNGPDRVSEFFPHLPVPQEPQMQTMITPESGDEISDEDFTIVDSSLPSAEQGNRSRGSERSRSRERVYPRSSSHASRQQQPVVPPPPGIQQNQGTPATVDPQNRVSNHSRSLQKQEDTQGPQTPKRKKNLQKISRVHSKKPRRKGLWIQMKTMKNQNEPGTSSN